MAFGLTTDINASDYKNLNRTGISHLISVSGLHLAVFSGFALKLFSILKFNKKIKYLLAILFSVAFAVFVGLSPAIVRALVMTVVYLFGKIINQQSDSLNSMGFSAIIIGVLKPQWTLSLGLWLSFLATAGIIVLGVRLSNKFYAMFSKKDSPLYNKIVLTLSTSLGISLGAYVFTLPVLIFSFGWVSLVSPLANLLVAPFAFLIVLLGIIIVLIPISIPFFPLLVYTVEVSSKMILELSSLLSRIPLSTFSFNHIALLILPVLILSLLFPIFITKKAKHYNNLLFLVVLLMTVSTLLIVDLDRKSHAFITTLPDNQLVIFSGNSAVVFVKADQYSADLVLEYLDYMNIREIETLVVQDYNGTSTDIFNSFANNYNLKSVIGPIDSYALNVLSYSLAGTNIYSPENATINSFSGLVIKEIDTANVNIFLSNQKIILSSEKYDIISEYDYNTIYFFEDSYLAPESTSYKLDLLGERIYKNKTIKVYTKEQ